MGLARRIRIWAKRIWAPYRRNRWLFLDDMRNPPDHLKEHFDVVRDFDQFTEHIESYGIPGLISFDHDLHPNHTMAFYEGDKWCGHCDNQRHDMIPTGYDCAVWLIEHCEMNGLRLGEVYVHSLNPVTADRIIRVMVKYQIEKNLKPLCRTIRWGIRDTLPR